MGMKTWLAPLFLSTPMLAACVQLTDFEAPPEGTDSSDGGRPDDGVPDDGAPTSDDGTPTSDTSMEPTGSADTEDSDTGPLCGNGMLDAAEECDDANQINGDGCQLDCTITGGETIWTVESLDIGPGVAVVALPDGGFVVGTRYGSAPSVHRFDVDGQPLWAQPLEHSVGELALSPDGDVIVVGTVSIDPTFAIGELWVGELSVDDGSEQWIAFPGIPLTSTHGRVIAVGPEGGLRVGGFSGGGGGSNVLMAGLAADGTLSWWDEGLGISTGYAETTDMVMLPDGSAVFVGVSEYESDYGLWARRVDAAGQELWMEGLDAGNATGSIVRRNDGALIIMGNSILIELDEDGTEQRRTTWNLDEVQSQWIWGTALAPDGDTLYVGGSSSQPAGGLYGAVDVQGGHLWAHLFSNGDPPNNGDAYDIAVLADGTVVFVGSVGNRDGIPHLWMRKTSP